MTETSTTHQEQFRQFARYNALFNEQIYTTVAAIPDQQRKQDMHAFFGSIHATLNHILLADRVWLGRVADAFPQRFNAFASVSFAFDFRSLNQELYADFAELRQARVTTDDIIRNWADELSAPVLAMTMQYANSKGVIRQHPLWLAVAHLFNHQTHHRGQLTTLLNQLGIDAGVTDFFAYADIVKRPA